MTGMLAFVAGATGFTGRELVSVLRERDVNTVAHVRPDSPRLEAWRQRFTARGASVDTTAWELEALTERLTDMRPTHVFCLVGTTRRRARIGTGSAVDETYEAVDYGLAAMLCKAARSVQPAPHFVLLSALGTSSRARGAYFRAHWRAEQVVRDSGLPHTIARAPFISGPGRDQPRPLERLGAAVTNGLLQVAPGRWRARYASMSPQTLARALVAAALDATERRITLSPEALRQLAEP